MYYRQISGNGVDFGLPFGRATRSRSRACSTSGQPGDVGVELAPSGARFVKLDLPPHQFVILE
jgi:hypothetical protein